MVNPLLSALADTFGGSSLGAAWTPYGVAAEAGGTLNITVAGGGANFNGCYSASFYDVTGNYGQVELVTAPAVSALLFADFMISSGATVDDNSIAAYFELVNGVIAAKARSGFTPAAGSPYWTATFDPRLHAFWRIREAGGTLFFDTSANGAVWTVRGAVAASAISGWSTSAVAPNSGASNSGGGGATTARFRNFNLVAAGVGTPHPAISEPNIFAGFDPLANIGQPGNLGAAIGLP